MKQGLLVFLLSIAAAVCYGIVHDQITARVCVEYFTIAHPPILGGTQDPTLLAFGWGVIATWWAGAIIGVPLALAARVGKLPKRSAASMIRPIGVLLACMALCALAAGITGYIIGSHSCDLVVNRDVPADKQVAFLADAFAHLASYASGFVGGMILVAWVLYSRWRAEVARRLAALRPDDVPKNS